MRSALGLLAVIAAGLLIAGCGGSDDRSVARLSTTTTATTPDEGTPQTSGNPQDAILAFARCLRGEGFDIPDPDLSTPGQGLRILRESGIDQNSPKFRAAMEKCQPNLEGIRRQFDPEQRQKLEQAAVDFAKCMRENGVDVPDPDFSGPPGQGGRLGLFGDSGIDPRSPKVQKAMEACQHVFTDAGLGRGPGFGIPLAPPQ